MLGFHRGLTCRSWLVRPSSVRTRSLRCVKVTKQHHWWISRRHNTNVAAAGDDLRWGAETPKEYSSVKFWWFGLRSKPWFESSHLVVPQLAAVYRLVIYGALLDHWILHFGEACGRHFPASTPVVTFKVIIWIGSDVKKGMKVSYHHDSEHYSLKMLQ